MGVFELAGVMDAIADAARAAGVVDKVYEWPASTLTPPCLVVGYPTSVTFDYTMARGHDRATFPVWIICGRQDERTARDVLSGYVSDGGARVKTALDGTLGGEVTSARVQSVGFETMTIGGVEYISAAFDLDVLT